MVRLAPSKDALRSPLTASLALLLGGALWGLYWIPVRFFADLGLGGPWPGIVMFTAALLPLIPLIWPMRRLLLSRWQNVVFSGVFTGAAFSLFTTSLVYTEVARSILLFYLTPVWGTVLGLVFLGERLRAGRVLGLVCGIAGLITVLGAGDRPYWPLNIGDWLALISGVTWALGTLGLYRSGGVPVPGQVFAFVSGALAVSLASILFGGASSAFAPSAEVVLKVLPYAVLSAVFIMPMLFLTIWPATRLSPARVGLLLMSEVIVGLLSVALLSDEPFGLRLFFGAILIVSACLMELTDR